VQFAPYISNVSIHAPARGATSLASPIEFLGIVSIHAPARGATPVQHEAFNLVIGFNPRARAGRDTSAT